jgi:hypothetical protein
VALRSLAKRALFAASARSPAAVERPPVRF